ncbi:MAG: 4Fe-4S dicluster domain-containing protein [Candidatus Latescibacterota bacterium]|nr:MAG: 4Fe-4S dicluster domain-containing protein [Candidatus Latescibacterota bacterium]
MCERPGNLRQIKVVERASLGTLFEAIEEEGYTIVGPTVREQTIVYDVLDSPDDLPVGWTDEHAEGTYRLARRDDDALFGYVVGPHTWKKYLFPPRIRLWSASRTSQGFEVNEEHRDLPKYAFLGVRACELNAILVQDNVFLKGPYIDPVYKSRRRNTLIVAVNCTQAGGACFCVSMDTGPKASGNFDLALTEVIEDGRHYFTIEVGSDRGREILGRVTGKDATKAETASAETAVSRAESQMGRVLDTKDIKEVFYNNYNHPRWDEVEKRCLACANCTMVCPTCFCTTVEDTTDLSGGQVERWRRWDSCFTTDFSFIVGGSIRQSTRSRYRQWITHKLATWIDQFGTSGCVGCGRCITWCPVGIDITEEARAIREKEPVDTSAGAEP